MNAAIFYYPVNWTYAIILDIFCFSFEHSCSIFFYEMCIFCITLSLGCVNTLLYFTVNYLYILLKIIMKK